MKYITTMLIVSFLSSQLVLQAWGQESGPINAIEEGLIAYKAKGAKAAVETWIAGSALEGHKGALSQSNRLNQIEEFYGLLTDYEIIHSKMLSNRLSVVYLILYYQKGPLFSRFVVFGNSTDQWIIVSFDFDTKVELLFPKELNVGAPP